MFSNLRQGNTVYILEQSDKLSLSEGQIVENKPNYTGGMDMKVKADGNDYEFRQVPYNQTITKNGSIIVSENLNTILNEVRNLKSDSENKLNNMNYYKQTISDCDQILRKYDVSYNKEQKMNEEIDTLRKQNSELKEQICSMQSALSDIKELLSKKSE